MQQGVCSADLLAAWRETGTIDNSICAGIRCEFCAEQKGSPLNGEKGVPIGVSRDLAHLFVHDPVERMAIEVHE